MYPCQTTHWIYTNQVIQLGAQCTFFCFSSSAVNELYGHILMKIKWFFIHPSSAALCGQKVDQRVCSNDWIPNSWASLDSRTGLQCAGEEDTVNGQTVDSGETMLASFSDTSLARCSGHVPQAGEPEEDRGTAGRITSLGWPGNTLGCHQLSQMRWLDRGCLVSPDIIVICDQVNLTKIIIFWYMLVCGANLSWLQNTSEFYMYRANIRVA